MSNGILVTYKKKTALKNTKEMRLNFLVENLYYTNEYLMKHLGKADGTIKQQLADLKKEGKTEHR